jgi:hypothetical protein
MNFFKFIKIYTNANAILRKERLPRNTRYLHDIEESQEKIYQTQVQVCQESPTSTPNQENQAYYTISPNHGAQKLKKNDS